MDPSHKLIHDARYAGREKADRKIADWFNKADPLLNGESQHLINTSRKEGLATETVAELVNIEAPLDAYDLQRTFECVEVSRDLDAVRAGAIDKECGGGV